MAFGVGEGAPCPRERQSGMDDGSEALGAEVE